MRAVFLEQISYDTAIALQEQFFYGKITAEDDSQTPEDILLFLEHLPVYTFHRRERDLIPLIRDSEAFWSRVQSENIPCLEVSRGGRLTFHGPGQLICYPILSIKKMRPVDYLKGLGEIVKLTLQDFGIKSEYYDSGVWVWREGSECKICSFGVRVKSGVTMHGFALNVSTDLSYFEGINPCGLTSEKVITSLAEILDFPPPLEEIAKVAAENTAKVFGKNLEWVTPEEIGFYEKRKPSWIKMAVGDQEGVANARALIRETQLHTVCEEAHCPNLNECWGRGDITVMILGDTCTRSCAFCAVTTGRPSYVDWDEPQRVAKAISQIPQSHIVITSVNRDELPDGGAAIWAETIRLAKHSAPHKTIEVLVPDFKGEESDIKQVLEADPHVFDHNIETIGRLQKRVRPQAAYSRSLRVLEYAKSSYPHLVTKSSIMVGHGESEPELLKSFQDLRDVEVDILTIGQYLRPTQAHLPVIRFYSPEEFLVLQREAQALGFAAVVAGPLVRTSYHAGEAYEKALRKMQSA